MMVNVPFGSTVRIPDRREPSRPSGGNPTFGLGCGQYVGFCAGFSDAASMRLSCTRCLPATEKRQGTKSRGRCAEGSGRPMGNRRRRDGRLGLQRGRRRWTRSCRGPVLIADPGAVSAGTAVAAPE
jgi:hypothetical protein